MSCCKRLQNIAGGFKALATGDNEELAKQRMVHCAPCAERQGVFCGLCACVVKAKVRVPNEQCPIGKWKIAV
jgi:hypothetical protein